MRRVRVIPVVLLKDQEVVKTTKFNHPTYVGDPINTVKLFNEKEVDELILLDISEHRFTKGPDFELIHQVVNEAFMPIAYGGGIRNKDDVKRLFEIGIEKVVINSSCFHNPSLIGSLVKSFGSQSVCVSIDYKTNWLGKKKVMINGGKSQIPYSPLEWALKQESDGAGEIMLTNINHEGTYLGYDIATIKQIAQAITIPLIAHGGASGWSDFLDAVKYAHASAIAAGSIFTFKRPHRAVLINYPSEEILKSELYSKL